MLPFLCRCVLFSGPSEPAGGLVGDPHSRLEQLSAQARLHPRPELAAVPKGIPVNQSWHTVRVRAMDKVCEIFGRGGGPKVAALTGRSGSGKTTAAASMVGERGPLRPRSGETEDQARTRLDRVRALFPDGVVWLRVGKGEGAADRLASLMLTLAKSLCDAKGNSIDGPTVLDDGQSYIKRIVSQKEQRYLVVADDVWETEVVDNLRKTGMWVLLTTRNASIVEPSERVWMDELAETEAEEVLRGAARLRPDERLNDGAMEILKICGFVAMDIAFVGSWGSVRTTQSGIAKSSALWADAVRRINFQIHDVKAQACGMNELDINRLAVLRAGFKYLGAQDASALELYLAIAVLPDGHAFQERDAAVLIKDEEAPADDYMQIAKEAIAILERWAVLRVNTCGTYRMHDAHASYARKTLMDRADIRKLVVRRWKSHISRLDIAVSMNVYTLLDVWLALEKVGGGGWWPSRPYDNQLRRMDSSDHSKIHAVNLVAELYEQSTQFSALEALMKQVLEDSNNNRAPHPGVKMAALSYISRSLLDQGRFNEYEESTRQLGELIGPSSQLHLPDCGPGNAQTSTLFNTYGVCAAAAGHFHDAIEWLRKSLRLQVAGGGAASLTVFTLHELGKCTRVAGTAEDAEKIFKEAICLAKKKQGAHTLQVADILHDLGSCVREDGRPVEAEAFVREALEIKTSILGTEHSQSAVTMFELGLCVGEAGRPEEASMLMEQPLRKLTIDAVQFVWGMQLLGGYARQLGRLKEAEGFWQDALRILESSVEVDTINITWTLQQLGRCVHEAGRPDMAAGFFKRALEIMEANGRVHQTSVAEALYGLGWCEQEAGRPRDAEVYLMRALKIQEHFYDSDALQVAVTLHRLAWCMGEGGRLAEAEGCFERFVEILNANFDANDMDLAWTLHELGRCVREAGRPGKAEGFLKRALEIKEAKVVADDVQVATTLYELGWCLREIGQLTDAEGHLERALEIFEKKMGADSGQVALTLHQLGRCVEKARRLGEAEGMLNRALDILEAKSEADDLQLGWVLQGLGSIVRSAKRPAEAEAFFSRSLEVFKTKVEVDDRHISMTLHELYELSNDSGRLGEAKLLLKEFLECVLGVRKARMGVNGLQVAKMRDELDLCVRERRLRGRSIIRGTLNAFFKFFIVFRLLLGG